MSHPRFVVPDGASLDHVADDLARRLGAHADDPHDIHRTWLDSFDWRLWNRGSTMHFDSDEQGGRLCWRTRDGDTTHAILRSTRPPRWPADIRRVRPRQMLEDILEMRALLPTVRVRGQGISLAVRDARDKTVAHIELSELEVLDDTGHPAPLGRRLEITSVRGYEEHADKVVATLLDVYPIAELTLLEEAVHTLGREPGDYSSKLNLVLKPKMRSDKATRKILRHVLRTLRRNEDGMRDDLDSEFLHDFRVAVRRTRSALSQIKGVFPDSVVTRYARDFRWLGQVTGLTRDLDVYLLSFPGFQKLVPADIAPHLSPLEAFLRDKQREAHTAMMRELDTPRYDEVLSSWTAFLAADVPRKPKAAHARDRIADLAVARIRKLHQRVLAEGGAIRKKSPPEALHDLRKTCKKLRYLLEFFRTLFPADQVGLCIKDLKKLQSNLGDFQDLEVQANTLTEYSREMLAKGTTPADTLLAVGVLVERLKGEQKRARREFHAIFDVFSSKPTRRRYNALLSCGGAQ